MLIEIIQSFQNYLNLLRMNLREMPVGARLVVQCKNDWRTAVVSSKTDEKVTLIISSASGKTYRKRCTIETSVEFDGEIPIIGDGVWRENLVKYDFRW
ncbi:hypothetical protein BH10ACI1_BH10ACI1_06200 [soil metagenome]